MSAKHKKLLNKLRVYLSLQGIKLEPCYKIAGVRECCKKGRGETVFSPCPLKTLFCAKDMSDIRVREVDVCAKFFRVGGETKEHICIEWVKYV